MLRDKRLPVDYTISDNNKAWQHVALNDMGLQALKFVTHLTGKIPDYVLTIILTQDPFVSVAITKKHGSQRRYFNDTTNYERFYKWVWEVSACWERDLCQALPGILGAG